MNTLKEKIISYLIAEPKARERRNKNRAIVNRSCLAARAEALDRPDSRHAKARAARRKHRRRLGGTGRCRSA